MASSSPWGGGSGSDPDRHLRRGAPQRLTDAELVGSTDGRGTARVEDAQGTPTQSHVFPSILVCEDEMVPNSGFGNSVTYASAECMPPGGDKRAENAKRVKHTETVITKVAV